MPGNGRSLALPGVLQSSLIPSVTQAARAPLAEGRADTATTSLSSWRSRRVRWRSIDGYERKGTFHHRRNGTGFEPQETSLNETFFFPFLFKSLIVFALLGFILALRSRVG